MKSSSRGKLDGVFKAASFATLFAVSVKNVGQTLCLGEEAEAGRDSRLLCLPNLEPFFFAGSVGGVWFG